MNIASLITIVFALIFMLSFVLFDTDFVTQSLEINSHKLIQTRDWLIDRHRKMTNTPLEELRLN